MHACMYIPYHTRLPSLVLVKRESGKGEEDHQDPTIKIKINTKLRRCEWRRTRTHHVVARQ